jgi:hypothetical protein
MRGIGWDAVRDAGADTTSPGPGAVHGGQSVQRRLWDDLHDGLGQELAGLSLLLSAFVYSTRHGKSFEVTDLERALDVAQHALQSCRSIARGLSPLAETQGGLIAGLRELVARLKTGSGPTLDELPRLVARSEVPHHAPRPCRDMRRLRVPAGRMKDINPNDDHSTLSCGVCAPPCND